MASSRSRSRFWRRERATDVIPEDIREAAREAGLSLPLWYVGRRAGPAPDGPSLHEVVMAARAEAGLCTECWDGHKIGEPHTGAKGDEGVDWPETKSSPAPLPTTGGHGSQETRS